MTVTCKAKYDKLNDKVDVTVVYEANPEGSEHILRLKLIIDESADRACALNTVMGLGIVF